MNAQSGVKDSYGSREEAGLSHWEDHYRKGWSARKYTLNPEIALICVFGITALVLSLAAVFTTQN